MKVKIYWSPPFMYFDLTCNASVIKLKPMHWYIESSDAQIFLTQHSYCLVEKKEIEPAVEEG